MPKFCEYCGAPLKEGAKFCVSCGHPVAQMSQPFHQNMNESRTYAPQAPNANSSQVEPHPYAQQPPQQPPQQPHQQPYQQPSQQPYQQPSMQPTQKKDNTLLIVLIALAVVLFVVKIIQTSKATRNYKYYYGQMMMQPNPSQIDGKTFFLRFPLGDAIV